MPHRTSRQILACLFACLLAPALLPAQSTPAGSNADQVMSHVEAEAAAAGKHVLLQFGASWCGNCRLFDQFLADPQMHPILAKAFVFAEMATGESANDTRHANLPGGVKLEDSLGGKKAGWPYIVMLDEQGKLLAGSVRPGKDGNIGYPASPDEIAWFMTMLRKGAPHLTPAELEAVQNWLIAHSPARAHA